MPGIAGRRTCLGRGEGDKVERAEVNMQVELQRKRGAGGTETNSKAHSTRTPLPRNANVELFAYFFPPIFW